MRMLHPPCFRPSEHKGVGKVLIFADFRYSHSHFLVFSAGLTVFILQFQRASKINILTTQVDLCGFVDVKNINDAFGVKGILTPSA